MGWTGVWVGLLATTACLCGCASSEQAGKDAGSPVVYGKRGVITAEVVKEGSPIAVIPKPDAETVIWRPAKTGMDRVLVTWETPATNAITSTSAPSGVAASPFPSTHTHSITIEFAFDKAQLDDRARQALSAIDAGNLLSVQVVGHTDSIGPDGYNNGLGARRAAAVKRYLTEHGVPAAQIVTSSEGEHHPIATNRTEQGRAHNRRAEVTTEEAIK